MTAVPFSTHTVSPVNGFEAQEFTAPGVGITVGTMLAPSMFMTETPGVPEIQAPLGMYETTSVPVYLARFVGQYELATQTVTVTLTGNVLTISVPGQATRTLTPDRDDRFDLEGLNGFSLEFITNDEGKSIARFHQPNGVFDAAKKES